MFGNEGERSRYALPHRFRPCLDIGRLIQPARETDVVLLGRYLTVKPGRSDNTGFAVAYRDGHFEAAAVIVRRAAAMFAINNNAVLFQAHIKSLPSVRWSATCTPVPVPMSRNGIHAGSSVETIFRGNLQDTKRST